MGIHYWLRGQPTDESPHGDIVEITDRCQKYLPDLTTNAEEGSVATSTIVIDDPGGDFFVGGHRKFYTTDDRIVDEDDQVTYVGYTWVRRIKRMRYRTGAKRAWEVELNDLNTVLSRRLMTSAAKDRPDETDVERVQALEASDEGSLIDDTTYLSTDNPVDMDAKDFRGQGFLDTLKTAADQSGKNYFVHNMPNDDAGDATLFSLWYDRAGSDAYSSTLRISNVIADVLGDGDGLTFYGSPGDELELDPSRVYSGVYGEGDGEWVYRTRTATSNAFALSGRDTSVPMDDLKTETKMNARADRMLRDMAVEDLEGTVTINGLPARLINHVKAGQRIQVRMSHWLPELREFVWYRVLSKQWREISEDPEKAYSVTLRLSPPDTEPPGTDSFAVLTMPRDDGYGNVHWENNGDEYPAGGGLETIVGPWEYVGVSGFWTGLQATEDIEGVDIYYRIDSSFVACADGNSTASILVNGTPIESTIGASYHHAGPGGEVQTLTVTATGVDIASGDVVEGYWMTTGLCLGPGPTVPAGASGPYNRLQVSSGHP